jgi:hypothetical protein
MGDKHMGIKQAKSVLRRLWMPLLGFARLSRDEIFADPVPSFQCLLLQFVHGAWTDALVVGPPPEQLD